MAQSNLKRPMNQNLSVGGSHSRSLSQPTFFANNCLPPLSPFPPPSESSFASSNSNFKDISMEEIDVTSRGPPIPIPFPRENVFRGNDSLLPPVRGHRRSNSDVPLGFSAMIQSSPQLVPISGQGNPDRMGNAREASGKGNLNGFKRREMDTVGYGIGEVKSEGEVVDELFNSFMNLNHVENKDTDTVSGTKMSGGENNNNGSESVFREGVKRSATGDIAPPARHYRSLSMDSAIMGNFHLGDESAKLQNQVSPGNSAGENSAKFNLDFGHGEFNDVELKKIMADERLAEIAVSDPKRAKRILANRQSAARSKERKLRYISELEHKVQTLQNEATTLSTQVTILQKECADLTNHNNALKFRVQAMEQQTHIRDALHETLNAEVQRLKLAQMELRDGRTPSNGLAQQVPMKHHMFPMHRQQPNNQTQQLPVSSSTTSATTSAGPTSA